MPTLRELRALTPEQLEKQYPEFSKQIHDLNASLKLNLPKNVQTVFQCSQEFKETIEKAVSIGTSNPQLMRHIQASTKNFSKIAETIASFSSLGKQINSIIETIPNAQNSAVFESFIKAQSIEEAKTISKQDPENLSPLQKELDKQGLTFEQFLMLLLYILQIAGYILNEDGQSPTLNVNLNIANVNQTIVNDQKNLIFHQPVFSNDLAELSFPADSCISDTNKEQDTHQLEESTKSEATAGPITTDKPQ